MGETVAVAVPIQQPLQRRSACAPALPHLHSRDQLSSTRGTTDQGNECCGKESGRREGPAPFVIRAGLPVRLWVEIQPCSDRPAGSCSNGACMQHALWPFSLIQGDHELHSPAGIGMPA